VSLWLKGRISITLASHEQLQQAEAGF